MRWIEACKASDLAVGENRCIEVEGGKIALFRTTTGAYAVDDFCPHRSGPLHQGWLKDDTIACPWHQWIFNLHDGKCSNIPGQKVRTFPVEERGGALWIGV